jgi:hypothetical protein
VFSSPITAKYRKRDSKAPWQPQRSCSPHPLHMMGKGIVHITQHITKDYIASSDDQYFIEAAREMSAHLAKHPNFPAQITDTLRLLMT